jgi:ubiquinone biosynthesis monooxygenase Coq7
MNLIDRLICEVDTGLRTVFARAHANRPLPQAVGAGRLETLADAIKAESIRLMRVNHCGEVCAQALYQGQALVARNPATKSLLLAAADEEHDHLAWCEARLNELGGTTSRLSPAFYAGAFGMGIASGLLGDKWSLGFLVETERQVEAHLHDHLGRLASEDSASRAILETMRDDEIRHGQSGVDHGGAPLPAPVKAAMRGFSKVMTQTTYWV